MTVKNTFRVGSTCHRAFHHIERTGCCTTVQLAQALDFDADELPGLLRLAITSGHLRRTGDLWEIGDGTPVTTPPAAPAPPAVTINTTTVPPAVREIPPEAVRSAVPKLAPAPAAPPAAIDAAVVNRPPAAKGVDIDRVHVRAKGLRQMPISRQLSAAAARVPEATLEAVEPAAAAAEALRPAAEASTLPAELLVPEVDQVLDVVCAPLAGLVGFLTAPPQPAPAADVATQLAGAAAAQEAKVSALRVALWNDGVLVIDRGDQAGPIIFNVDETRVILAYLDRLGEAA